MPVSARKNSQHLEEPIESGSDLPSRIRNRPSEPHLRGSTPPVLLAALHCWHVGDLQSSATIVAPRASAAATVV